MARRARSRKTRTPAQKAATRKMLAANRARRLGRKARIVGRRVLRRVTRRRPRPPMPTGVPKMARRRRRRPLFARRRRSTRRAPSRRRRSVRSGQRGSASVGLLAGLPLGFAAATGGAALLNMAAGFAGVQLPQVVKDYAPLAGAAVVYGLTRLTPKFRNLGTPALLGGALALGLQMWAASRAGAGSYGRLRGSGAVARVLGNPNGAGAVARVLGSNVAA